MRPIVSVIIPTFNRGHLLPQAIDSVLAQTHQDREIIVIDDGSTDDTRERLAPYMPRLRYFHQSNAGVSAALNRGIELAEGQWVAILASDDMWAPRKLELQFAALTALGHDFGACFTDCVYVGNPALRSSAFQEAGLACPTEFGVLDHPRKYVLARYPAIYVQSLLVLRSLLERLNGFDEHMLVGEDTEFLFRLTFNTRFCYVTAPLVTIDRTPSRAIGLMELFAQRNDRVFECTAYRFKKWLGLREFTDLREREIVENSLRQVYYDWAVANLYRFRVRAAADKIRHIRTLDDSAISIFFTFFCRALRKLYSTLGERWDSVTRTAQLLSVGARRQ